jgi:hypothetical protein
LTRVGCAALLAAVVVACAVRRPAAPPAATFGDYAATWSDGAGDVGFRLLLWAEAPDRLHAEALSALGTPRWILDGGGGRLSVVVPAERAAWSGAATPEALAGLLGFRTDLPGLVAALLGGPTPEGLAVIRHGEPSAGLPERFELRADAHHLVLERRGARPLGRSATALGSAVVPDDWTVRPLGDLGSLVRERAAP